MRLLLAVVLCAVLSACASTPKTIETVRYINRVPPAELLMLPPRVEPIDLKKATQADIAEWLLRYHERTGKLEAQLQAILEFYAK